MPTYYPCCQDCTGRPHLDGHTVPCAYCVEYGGIGAQPIGPTHVEYPGPRYAARKWELTGDKGTPTLPCMPTGGYEEVAGRGARGPQEAPFT